MRVGLARTLLICLTILGLLAPRISAGLALAAPGAQTVVICTGMGMQTLRLDAEGNPLPAEEAQPDLCLLVHAADTAMRMALPPAAAELAAVARRPDVDLVLLSDAQAARPPPRAPPAV